MPWCLIYLLHSRSHLACECHWLSPSRSSITISRYLLDLQNCIRNLLNSPYPHPETSHIWLFGNYRLFIKLARLPIPLAIRSQIFHFRSESKNGLAIHASGIQTSQGANNNMCYPRCTTQSCETQSRGSSTPPLIHPRLQLC